MILGSPGPLNRLCLDARPQVASEPTHATKAISETTWMATSAVGNSPNPERFIEVQPRGGDPSGDGPDDHRDDEAPAERAEPRVGAAADGRTGPWRSRALIVP
jgi:hypothetical protein